MSKSSKKLKNLCEIISKNNSNTILPINMDFYKASNDDYINLKIFLEGT